MIDKYCLTKKENIFLIKKNLINEVYAGANLEGVNVTFPETQAILDGVNVSSLDIDDIVTILNLRDAWKYVVNNIDEEFSLNYICKINELVSRNQSLEWGVLRTGKIGISGTEYVPPLPKEENVNEIISKIINSNHSTTEKAIEYMLIAMRSQFFWDGNKRTATICANKIMMDGGAGIICIHPKHLLQFNELLSTYYSIGDMDKIKYFIYENCIEGIEHEIKKDSLLEKEKTKEQEGPER